MENNNAPKWTVKVEATNFDASYLDKQFTKHCETKQDAMGYVNEYKLSFDAVFSQNHVVLYKAGKEVTRWTGNPYMGRWSVKHSK